MKKMKTGVGMGLVVLLVVLSAAPLWAQRSSMSGDIEVVLQAMEAGILLMRGEEKLARDVYQNRVKDSRNHLRASARQRERYEGDYDPQYITTAE